MDGALRDNQEGGTHEDASPEAPPSMLMDRQQAKEPDEDDVRSEGEGAHRLLFVLVTIVSLIALTLAALFIARLPIVSGPTLRALLEREARARGMDIYIESMRPKGLFDVRLERVRLRTRRGAYVLDTNLSHLDVSPDLLESITQRRPVPGQLVMTGAEILIERRASLQEHTPSLPPDDRVARSAASGLKGIDVVGKDVRVSLKAGSFATTKVFEISRVNASIPLQGVPLPTSMSAYGTFPDGVPFALSTSARPDGLPGRLITLESSQATQIEQWFEGQVPFSMAATGLTICSGCEQDRVELGAVELALPNFGKGLRVSAPEANLTWLDGRGELRLGEVEIKGIRSALDLEMERLELGFDLATGVQHGELTVREGALREEGGDVTFVWDWTGREQVLKGTLSSNQFALGPLMELLDATPYLHRGELSGQMDFMVDWPGALVESKTSLVFKDASLDLPFVASGSISTPLLALDSEVLVDLRGRAVSVEHLEVTLKDVRPLRLRANLIDATQGWRFDIEAFGRDIHAPALVEALPTIITTPIKGATLQGYFGFDFRASGHSAYPESLRLEIDFEGDVDVVEDGQYANIGALAGGGYPAELVERGDAIDFPTPARDWVSLSNLPAHIPRGLLAAEDAAFYRHNGFDFGGLARAMIHNLKVRRMERGGSTITQQLVKNLFLTRERTAMRKLQEAYLTWRVEEELGKQRILELYLNMVHWGDGVHGIHAAAAHYFGALPQDVTVDQMALLGTLLPNPERFGGQIKRGFIASSRIEKFEHVLANLRFLGHIRLDDYHFWMNRATRGQVGGLDLTVCRDDDMVPEDVPRCE